MEKLIEMHLNQWDKIYNLSKELIRYGVVGILQNSFGYFLYLILTWVGIDPKIVVAVSYPIGVYLSFVGNKNFTFKMRGNGKASTNHILLKYIKVHISAYVMNLVLLFVFADIFGYPHQIVQLFCILIVAAYLFLMFKLYVFVHTPGLIK